MSCRRRSRDKPAALTATSTVFPELFPQPGSRREGDTSGDNAINFHSAFAKYRKGRFKDFLKITSKQLEGGKKNKKEEREKLVSLLGNSDNGSK